MLPQGLMPTLMLKILGEMKPAMQARVVIVVTALVTMTDLVAALAMTTTMGLAMAVMMTVLAAIPVATVRGSARRKAVVAIIVAKEAGQMLRRRRRSAECRQGLLEKAV